MSNVFECKEDMDRHDKDSFEEALDPIEADAQPKPHHLKNKTYIPNLRELS